MLMKIGLAALLAVALSAPAIAAGSGHSHAAKDIAEHAMKDASLSQEPLSQGKVKRINKRSNKVTIKHGEIKNLGMPPMTMVFRVADEQMLTKLRKGDDVSFRVEDINGKMVITKMQAR